MLVSDVKNYYIFLILNANIIFAVVVLINVVFISISLFYICIFAI